MGFKDASLCPLICFPAAHVKIPGLFNPTKGIKHKEAEQLFGGKGGGSLIINTSSHAW